MTRQHYRLNGHEFEQTLEDSGAWHVHEVVMTQQISNNQCKVPIFCPASDRYSPVRILRAPNSATDYFHSSSSAPLFIPSPSPGLPPPSTPIYSKAVFKVVLLPFCHDLLVCLFFHHIYSLTYKRKQNRTLSILLFIFIYILFYFFISWRLITLQYYSGFCHTLT